MRDQRIDLERVVGRERVHLAGAVVAAVETEEVLGDAAAAGRVHDLERGREVERLGHVVVAEREVRRAAVVRQLVARVEAGDVHRAVLDRRELPLIARPRAQHVRADVDGADGLDRSDVRDRREPEVLLELGLVKADATLDPRAGRRRVRELEPALMRAAKDVRVVRLDVAVAIPEHADLDGQVLDVEEVVRGDRGLRDAELIGDVGLRVVGVQRREHPELDLVVALARRKMELGPVGLVEARVREARQVVVVVDEVRLARALRHQRHARVAVELELDASRARRLAR